MSRAARGVLWAGLGLGIVVLALFVFPIFFVLPGLALAGSALAALYTAIVLWLLHLTRPAWPGGRAWVVAALLWGSGTSFGVVSAAGLGWFDIIDHWRWDPLIASFGGAYPEEPAKALGVFLLLLSFRELRRPWHGFLAGAVVGLGFETTENLLYSFMGALMDPVSDWDGFWAMWGLRVVAGPCLHVVFTAIAGWGVGWALYAAEWSRLRRVGVAAGFLAFAFAGHFLWNITLDTDAWWVYAPMVCSALLTYPTVFLLLHRARRLAAADPGYVAVKEVRTRV